jgi:hypothetical protein
MVPAGPVRRHRDMELLLSTHSADFQTHDKTVKPTGQQITNTPRSQQTIEQIPAVSHTVLAPP